MTYCQKIILPYNILNLRLNFKLFGVYRTREDYYFMVLQEVRIDQTDLPGEDEITKIK